VFYSSSNLDFLEQPHGLTVDGMTLFTVDGMKLFTVGGMKLFTVDGMKLFTVDGMKLLLYLCCDRLYQGCSIFLVIRNSYKG
jgi:hypothetical protein